MPPFIPENILDQILDKCDIAEIISSYIPLKRVGRSYKALCPFHHEKTPSFIVNPEKGIFHCFGCGVGGNVFSFIMKYERLEFPEVAAMLAKKTGVSLPERTAKESKESVSLISELYRIHELAAAYFQNVLASPSGRRALDYLGKRGVTRETTGKFRLGFATDTWDGLLVYLKKKGLSEALIEKTGLIIPRSDRSGHYDRFRNRLIFPIFSQKDKIIAFAGRVLDESLPKYMNSPETQIYNKSRTLFGLNFARKHIGEMDAAVVVEGYMDLLTPHQTGMKSIIASCGTALTGEHIRILKRYTRNIIMVYDSDKAGQMATLRSLDLLLAEDMRVGIAQLPKGLDPDSFVRKNGIGAFQRLVENPIDLFEYKLNVLKAIHNTGSADSKVKIATEILDTISRVNNAILKSEYLKRLAGSLDLDENSLRTELGKTKKRYDDYDGRRTALRKEEAIPISAAEKIIISVMLEDNGLIPAVKERLDCREFLSESARKLAEFIFTSHEQGRPINYTTMMTHIDIEGISNLLSEIAATHLACTDVKKNLEDCIAWIQKDNMKQSLKRLQDEIKEAQHIGEQNRLTELVVRYDSLVKEIAKSKRNFLKSV